MNSKEEFIKEFQDLLTNQFQGFQNWWAKSLFHFTDISNALSILEHQALLSRSKATKLGLMKNDNANDDVISKTSQEHQEYARLYFAPSTPTQHNNEGFRPKNEIKYNAHCPFPIMFVFSFRRVFMLDNVKFTDGNLATNPNIYSSIFDLKELNFNLIYHRTWFTREDRDKIINARHSEILVKNELTLNGFLHRIVVRSEAEKETFLYLMSNESRILYQDKIYIQPKSGIFVNDWLYVEKIFIIENVLSINWHHCSHFEKCHNHYKLTIFVNNLDTGIKKTLTGKDWYPEANPTKFRLSEQLQNSNLELSIFIDDNLAYKNIFPL